MRDTAFELLPEPIRKCCEKITEASPEEIRLRLGETARLQFAGVELDTYSPSVTEDDLQRVLEKATSASLHSYSDGLKNGFVPFKGIRIGVCGQTVTKNGEIYAFSRYTSLNIRIPHSFVGDLRTQASEILSLKANTLIISPPGVGKTTALRELIRLISNGGYRVSVADDRGEIFPQCGQEEIFSRGCCTDVLSGADKESAALILLRTMNPCFIALDEISKRQEMKKRPVYKELLEEGIFSHALEIGMNNGVRTYTLRRI